MELQLGEVLLLLTLAIAAYQDVREKRISLYIPMIAIGVGMIWRIIFAKGTGKDILLGCLVGVSILLISWVSKQSIGMGDGLMLIVSGVFMELWMNVTLLMIAFGLVAVTGLYMLVVKKKGKDYRLPFLPYLLVAYVCMLI